MSKKLLTVIIPAKNEDGTLRLLIDCLSQQSFQNFDIIVADSSDTDVVRSICKNNNIRCISGGLPGEARNNGALQTDTEYLLFLDADMYIEQNFIEKAIEKMDSKRADCLSFGFIPRTSNFFLIILHFVARYYFFISTKIGFAHGIGGVILVKRRVHFAVNGFDEEITVAEDHDYVKRISSKFNFQFLLNPLVKVNVRRFKKEGIFALSFKYFIIEMHRISIGEIRHKRIPYFETK